MPSPTPGETCLEDVPAVEVELADGNVWGLALPGPRLHSITHCEVDPFGRPRVRIELVARVGYPLGIRRLWDEVLAADREGDAAQLSDAFRRLTVALLRLTHEIELAEAEALLDPRRVDPVRLARTLVPAAFGDAESIRSGGR